MSKYRFETIREDYSHYASGNVFAGATGNTGFPVRLASEVFQACLALLPVERASKRVVVYDPFCGAGYLLATVGYRHWASIQRLVGSDTDDRALQIARYNLSMLNRAGLVSKLDYLLEAQGSDWRLSRDATIRSVHYFLERLAVLEASHSIDCTLFRADAGCLPDIVGGMQQTAADIVMTDLPYGVLSNWQGVLANAPSHAAAITTLLQSLQSVMSPNAVAAIISCKSESVAHPAFRRRRRLKLGKRMVTFLSPA